MKVLGNTSHIANSGKLIVISDKTPPAGALVFDKNKNKIGKIVDIFGPVKTPFISIRIFKSANIKNLENNFGEEVYISSNRKNKRGNKSRQKKNKKT